MKNATSTQLTELYVSHVGTNSWEENILNGTVDPGEDLAVTVADGRATCEYDIKAVFSDGGKAEFRNRTLRDHDLHRARLIPSASALGKPARISAAGFFFLPSQLGVAAAAARCASTASWRATIAGHNAATSGTFRAKTSRSVARSCPAPRARAPSFRSASACAARGRAGSRDRRECAAARRGSARRARPARSAESRTWPPAAPHRPAPG